MSEWIDAKEWEPSDSRLVLVVYKAHKCPGRRSILFARHSGGQWRFMGPTRSRLDERVTHWMELPDCPRVSPEAV